MANIKITELDAATTLASTDVLVAVDVSEDVTKKTTVTNLFRTLPDGTAAAPALAFSSDAANGVYLAGTDTVGISTGGTQRFTVDGSGNVTISGGLTVEGQTTTVESVTVTIDDKNIELGSVASPSDTTADGGGITLKGATDKEIKWVNSTGYWTFNTGIDVGGNIELADNSRIKLGTGDDLQIYHDGTNSFINNSTGGLFIDEYLDDGDITLRTDDGSGGFANYIVCDGSSGSTKLFYYGSLKLATKTYGIDVTGEVQCDSLDVDGAADITGTLTLHGNLDLQDSDIIKLGSDDDLEIYHDGTDGVIRQVGAGDLYIQNTTDDKDVIIRSDNGSGGLANYVVCDGSAGDVRLYKNGSQKLQTASGGINVTGEVECDSLDVDGTVDIDGGQINYNASSNFLRFTDNCKATFGASDDLQIYHDGSNSFIRDAGAGSLKIRGTNLLLESAAGEAYIFCTADGSTKVYHNNDKKLETTSAGIDVTGEVQCDSLDVDGDGDVAGTLRVNRLIVDDDGSTSPTFSIRTDDSSPWAFTLGNDSYASSEGVGFRIYQSNTGEVNIRHTGNNEWKEISLQQQNGSTVNTAFHVNASRAVSLRYQSVEKLRTKSDGVDITGELQCDSLDVDGSANISGTASTLLLLNSTHSNGGSIRIKNSGNDKHFFGSAADFISGGSLNQTGIRSNEEILLSVGGQEKARLDTSGRMLLGTTTEGNGTADNLTIADSGECGITIRSGSSNNGSLFFSDATTGSGEYDGYIQYRHNDRALRFATAATERFRIDSSGRVLINSTNPATNDSFLTVQNSSGSCEVNIMSGPTSASVINLGDTGDYNIGRIKYDQTTNSLQFNTNNSEQLRLDSAGRLMLGTTTEGQASADNLTVADSGACGITIRSGSTSDGSLFFSDATSGVDEYRGYVQYDHAVNTLFFGSNAIQRLAINSNGAWGIEGANNYGTSGQILTSNGNDAPSWQDAGSVAVGGSAAISMNDGVKVKFGAGDDLQISHDGSNSFVDNNTGDLFIRNAANDKDVVLSSDNSSGGITQYVRCDGSDGMVRLYYYGSEKFQTVSGGVNIIGEMQCDSLDVDGGADITGNVTLHANLDLQDSDRLNIGSSDDLSLYHNGTDSFIDNSTGDLYIRGVGDDLYLRATDDIFIQPQGNDNGIVVKGDAEVELYYNNSQKLETTSFGVDVTGSITCDGLTVDGSLKASNGDGIIHIQDDNNTGNNVISYLQGIDTNETGKWYIGYASTGNQDLYISNQAGGQIRFRSSNTDRIIMQAAGHFVPQTNNSIDLGSSSNRWRNVYTNDLNLSNEGSGNDVDGTWGNYTIQEGEDDLFLINRRNGKKYKFNLTEVS